MIKKVHAQFLRKINLARFLAGRVDGIFLADVELKEGPTPSRKPLHTLGIKNRSQPAIEREGFFRYRKESGKDQRFAGSITITPVTAWAGSLTMSSSVRILGTRLSLTTFSINIRDRRNVCS